MIVLVMGRIGNDTRIAAKMEKKEALSILNNGTFKKVNENLWVDRGGQEFYIAPKESEFSSMTKQETMEVLEKHFNACLRYWERELKVDSDLSKEAYIHAINEIATTDPTKPSGEKLNPEWVTEFRNHRLMDCYGNGWEEYKREEHT